MGSKFRHCLCPSGFQEQKPCLVALVHRIDTIPFKRTQPLKRAAKVLPREPPSTMSSAPIKCFWIMGQLNLSHRAVTIRFKVEIRH